MTESDSFPSTARLVYLDGLRGLAALMVVLFHFWGGAGNPSWPVNLSPIAPTVTVDLLSPIGALGGSRVSLFFVLSGFLLYLPFVRREDETKRVTLVSWLRRRFRRLMPPYYAALPLALFPIVGTFYCNEMWRVLGQHQSSRSPDFNHLFDAFPSCLFFLHGLFPKSAVPLFNGPLWTLTPEVQLYFAFPLLAALARCRLRVGKRYFGGLNVIIVLAVILSVAYRVWLYNEIGFSLLLEGNNGVANEYHCLVNTFLGRLAEFALGMGAAATVVRGRLPSLKLLLPLFAVCLAWFLVLRSDIAVGGWVGYIFLAMEPAPSPLADAVGGVAFALLILCCAAAPRFAQFFAWQPLVSVGAIAYSLYLIHAPILAGLHRLLFLLHWDTGVVAAAGKQKLWIFALNLFVGFPLALLVARWFWFVFERPFLSRERRVTLDVLPPIIS